MKATRGKCGAPHLTLSGRRSLTYCLHTNNGGSGGVVKIFPKTVTFLRVVASLIVATTSVATNSHGRAQELETLDTHELRRLLHNASLTRVEHPGVITSDPGTETFYESGEYVRWGDRAHRRGAFEIDNGSVCIRLNQIDGPECFRLQRDRDGVIWKVDGNGIRTQVYVSSME
jgi:hypothetical protein